MWKENNDYEDQKRGENVIEWYKMCECTCKGYGKSNSVEIEDLSCQT